MAGLPLRNVAQVAAIAVITLAMLLACDFFFGKALFERLLTKNNTYRVVHGVYHHDFTPDYRTAYANWGPLTYTFCSDGNGFKSSCEQVGARKTSFDLAFIGDSFTEAQGQPYEQSFVGMVAAAAPQLSIANLGVASYSPAIYRAKLEYLLAQGYRFDEVVVFIDISDIRNEATLYRYENGIVRSRQPESNIAGIDIEWHAKLALKHFPMLYEGMRNASMILRGTWNQAPPPQEPVTEQAISAWTYAAENPSFGPIGVEGGIDLALAHMTALHQLLKRHDVPMSIAVYPWPAQLAHDSRNSRQVRIWREFCLDRCRHFIDLFPLFFDEVEQSSLTAVLERYYIEGDVHFNAAGNRLIADRLIPVFAARER